MDDLLPGGPASLKRTHIDSASMLHLDQSMDLDLILRRLFARLASVKPRAARDGHRVAAESATTR